MTAADSAAQSPTGAPHPGELTNVDERDGRTWTTRADATPQMLGWVEVAGTWRAVVRVEIGGGAAGPIHITRFAVDGTVLDRTVTAPPSQADVADAPLPTPTDRSSSM